MRGRYRAQITSLGVRKAAEAAGQDRGVQGKKGCGRCFGAEDCDRLGSCACVRIPRRAQSGGLEPRKTSKLESLVYKCSKWMVEEGSGE